MERYLELHVTQVDDNEVSFKINRQYHRGDEFCAAGKKFEASNGVLLISESIPGFYVSDDKLVCSVRGVIPECDNTTLTVTHKQFALIMQAISEYNETNGAGYKKPWPQVGDEFYFVSEDGSIAQGIYRENTFWEKCVIFGNCFRTKEDAEAARERIKETLKGE